MDFSGLPDQIRDESEVGLLTGLPDTNADALRKRYQATSLSPDEAAEGYSLADKSGLPKAVVDRNRPTVKRKVAEPDWLALEGSAPLTVHELARNTKFFDVAHDDTENLGGIERTLGNITRQLTGPLRAMGAGLLTDFNAAAWGWAEGSAKALGGERIGQYFAGQRKASEATGRRIAGDYGTRGFVEQSVAGGARSFGALIPGFVASLMTNNPSLMLGMGSATSGGQAVARGLEAGASPIKALAYGIEDATAEWATEMIPVAALFKDLKVGAPLYKLVARQMATEVPTELAATAWQNFNEWANLNPEQSFDDYLTKLGPDEALTVGSTITQTLLTAGMAHGTNKIVQRIANRQAEAGHATRGAEALAKLAQLSSASKLRARDPQTFQDFIDVANEEGPVQDVYLDARTLGQAGIDIEALAQVSPAVAEQLQTLPPGCDIIIPIGEYASRIAGTELDTLLSPHLRTDAEAMSAAEAQTFFQTQTEEFAKAATQLMEENAENEEWMTSAKTVETQLLDQLNQAKRFTPDVNTAYATLMRDFYVTTAQELGITPTEMFERYPLRISAESVADGPTLDYGQAVINALVADIAAQKGSGTTQVATTPAMYQKALSRALSKMPHIKNVLDYGAGLGLGTDAMRGMGRGVDVHSYEVNPERWRGKTPPDFTKSSEIVGTYDLVMSTNVLNVLEPNIRDQVVKHIASLLTDTGAALITTRGWEGDIANNKNFDPAPEDKAMWVHKKEGGKAIRVYQKGFDGNELANYVQDILGPGFIVRKIGGLGKSAIVISRTGVLFQADKANLGEITFAEDITQQPTIISLLKNANLTTFLHEMGHFQLEVMSHIAAQPNAPQRIAEDFGKLLEWFKPGMTLGDWQTMALEEKRPYHEQLARGFEAYLFEGKAPSAELNRVFARLRSWLINAYKSALQRITKNVADPTPEAIAKVMQSEINDDIRRVFDRLLATEEAIRQAEAMRAYGALFKSAEEMGVDAEEWAEYQATTAEATSAAMDDLQRKSLGDMRWLTNARNRTLKRLQKDAKTKRVAIQEEVTAEVRAMPVYAIQRFLRYGELDGEQVTGAKLSLPDLKEMYGEGPAAPWRYLSTGPNGLAATEGLSPDQVAEMFPGFTSGDHLVRAILAAAPEAEMIEGMTDQRMLERYGDISSPDALNRAADEAIHNEARARFVATELRALDKANTPVRTLVKAAKAFAEATIARKKVREIKPNQHAAAEVRASRAAEKALISGDRTAAAVEKRNQLVQQASTKAAYNALAEIEKAVRYLRKFGDEGSRKSIDAGYLDQIDQILERIDLRAGVTGKVAAKRASLLAWVDSQREQGFEPDIPPELLTEALRQPYRELTLEELRGVVDTVKQIEHLGRLKRKLLTSKDEREFAAIRDEIATSIEDNAKKVVDLRTRNTALSAAKDIGKGFLAMHRKMASMAREMDGFEDGGPMWEYFIRSMNAAGDNEATRRADATERLYNIFKPLLSSGGKMGGKGIYFPSLWMSFNREERIAIALNLGNAGNTQRLLDGEGWTMAQLQPLLDTITPGEALFVQQIWDFFESYRPEIAAKERRVYGKEPNWVEPVPIRIGGQDLRGGYYPIRYDTRRTGRAEQHAEAEAAKQQMRGAYTSSTTRRSFTKARAEAVTGRPLLYSFSGVYLGANEILHDLAWHEWLIDANRLLRSLDGVIRTHYGAEGVAVFKKGIEDIAAGDAGAANAFEKGLNHIRTGATIAGLAWNLTTALFQPLGLTQSAVRIGPKWVVMGLSRWLANPLDASKEISEKSEMMRNRAKTIMREINEIQNQVNASKIDPIRSTFFLLIQKTQLIADVPTWLGAYEKAITEGNTEDRAVALADQAVLDSQGGGQIKDLSQIQRGSALMKLFTNFYSFFNVAYNLGLERTKEKIGQPKLYPSLALDYLFLYIVPSVLSTLLRSAVSPGDDDDNLLEKLIADQISYMMGLMIGLREISAAAQKVVGVEQYKGAYGGPAGLRLFQEIDKLGQQIGQGEADKALLKSINNVGGIMLHYPSGQVARTVDGAAAIFEGRTENPAALVVGGPR